jgi:hypothetical protein
MPTRSVRSVNTPASFIVDDITLTTTINESGIHYIQCNRCLENITLTKTAHVARLVRHQGARPCRRVAEAKGLPYFYGHSTARNISDNQSTSIPPTSSTIVSGPSISITEPEHHDSSGDEESVPCPGISVEWTPGSIWATYPYNQHTTGDLEWTPVSFDQERNQIVLQSSHCLVEVSPSPKGVAVIPCLQCQGLVNSDQFQTLQDRAKTAQAHTPWDRLTYQQLDAIARRMARELKGLQKKVRLLL